MSDYDAFTCPRCNEQRGHGSTDEAACVSCGVCAVCVPTGGQTEYCEECWAPSNYVADYYTAPQDVTDCLACGGSGTVYTPSASICRACDGGGRG